MSDPASDALVTAVGYREFADIKTGDSFANDDRINLFINSASKRIARKVDRALIAGSVGEVLDGDGTREYIVANRPLNELTSIESWDGSAWDVLTDANYPRVVDSDKGLVYFTGGGVFGSGFKNYRVTYEYGWTLAAMPDDVKQACFLLVQAAFLKSRKGPIASESLGDTTTTFSWEDAEKEAMSLIQPYARPSFG